MKVSVFVCYSAETAALLQFHCTILRTPTIKESIFSIQENSVLFRTSTKGNASKKKNVLRSGCLISFKPFLDIFLISSYMFYIL